MLLTYCKKKIILSQIKQIKKKHFVKNILWLIIFSPNFRKIYFLFFLLSLPFGRLHQPVPGNLRITRNVSRWWSGSSCSGVFPKFVRWRCWGLFHDRGFPVFRWSFQYVVDGSAFEPLSQQTAASMFFASHSVAIESELSTGISLANSRTSSRRRANK